MTEKDPEEAKHQRLLLLSEFDGEVDGELKYHKSLYQYRNHTSAANNDDWSFTREERGPTDRGFSSVIQSYEDLELVEQKSEKNRRDFILKAKGERVAKGVRRGLSKLDEKFETRLSDLSDIAEQNKDRSGSEIVEDESIQDAKKETYQSKL